AAVPPREPLPRRGPALPLRRAPAPHLPAALGGRRTRRRVGWPCRTAACCTPPAPPAAGPARLAACGGRADAVCTAACRPAAAPAPPPLASRQSCREPLQLLVCA